MAAERSANGQLPTLQFGDTIDRQLGGGQSHSFQFDLVAGQFLQFVVQQQGIDVVLTIFDAERTKLFEVDRPNGSRGRETISMIAHSAGRYLIQIRSLESVAAQGQYQLTVGTPRMARPQDQTRIAAEKIVSEAEAIRAKASAGFFRQAVERFEQAADLWRSLNEPYEEAVALYGAGISYSSLGDNQRAIENLERALRLFRNDSYGEAIARAAMGWPYMYLGDYDSAEKNFSYALRYHQSQANVRGEGLTLYGLGWVFALRGDEQSALKNFTDSLSRRREAKDRRGEALTLTGIGKIQMRLRDHAKALKAFDEAFNVLPEPHDRYVEADILSNKGWAYSGLNEHDLALAHFKRALQMRREVGDRIGEATTLLGLSRLQRQSNRLSEARDAIEDALKIIESLRVLGSSQQLRISYFASIQEYYDYHIALLMELDRLAPNRGYSALALHATEGARARSLIDILTQANISFAARDQHLTVQAEPLTAAQIQQELLDQSTMLLEYALGEEKSYAWLVAQDEISSFELPPKEYVERVAREFYESMTERNRFDPTMSAAAKRSRLLKADAKANEKARVLSEILLSPIEETLRAGRLLIVAPGTLQFIPFAALPSPSTHALSGNRQPPMRSARREVYRPLLADHELVVLPSATTLAVLRQITKNRKVPPKTVAVIADPVFTADDARVRPALIRRRRPHETGPALEPDSVPSTSATDQQRMPEFPRLISSRWEAGQILSLAPPPQGAMFLDFAANRALLSSAVLPDYRFIHLATHAVVDDQRPERSKVVFSAFDEQGRAQDGFVNLVDIFDLKLPVEMVVLSACRTGLGKDFKGEGLVGLTRGFMYAGARRVVVSLWEVSDRATAELMVHFYRKMLGPEKLSPAAALRAAQLELSRDPRWQSPYFWAAFVLQGEPN